MSLKTLADAGLETFVLFTDPGMETISDDSRIKWKYIPPATASWDTMISMAKLINTMTNEGLQKMSGSGAGAASYTQFIDVLIQCNDFKVDGVSYGDISKWSTGRVFAFGCFENATQGLDTLVLQLDQGAGGFSVVPSTNIPGNGQGWNELNDLARFGDELWAVGHGTPVFSATSDDLTLVERSFLGWHAARR